jgi:hypothetical protein
LNLGHFGDFTQLSIRVENRVCLSRGVQLTGATWLEVGDLVQRTGDGRTGRVLGGRMIEMSGDVVCALHRAQEDEERGFLGGALKPRSMIY